MAYVILDACSKEKSGECVKICPVDCIEEGPNQFYINPNLCIDCGACVVACPVEAIIDEYEMLPEHEKFLEKAEDFFS